MIRLCSSAFGHWLQYMERERRDSYVSHICNCMLASGVRTRRLRSLGVVFEVFRDRQNAARQNMYLDNLVFSQLNRSARAGKQAHFGAWASILDVDEFESPEGSDDGCVSETLSSGTVVSSLWGWPT